MEQACVMLDELEGNIAWCIKTHICIKGGDTLEPDYGGFDDELRARLRRLAKREGLSLNQAALELL